MVYIILSNIKVLGCHIPGVAEYCVAAFEMSDVFGEVVEGVPGETKVSLSELC